MTLGSKALMKEDRSWFQDPILRWALILPAAILVVFLSVLAWQSHSRKYFDRINELKKEADELAARKENRAAYEKYQELLAFVGTDDPGLDESRESIEAARSEADRLHGILEREKQVEDTKTLQRENSRRRIEENVRRQKQEYIKPIMNHMPLLSERVEILCEVHVVARKAFILGCTNLPSGTDLMIDVRDSRQSLTAERVDYFWGQSKQTVRPDGSFETEGFGPDNGLDSGAYVASVMMPISDVQPPSVQAIIGNDSENLKGPLIRTKWFGRVSARVVQVERSFWVP